MVTLRIDIDQRNYSWSITRLFMKREEDGAREADVMREKVVNHKLQDEEGDIMFIQQLMKMVAGTTNDNSITNFIYFIWKRIDKLTNVF